MSLFTNGVVAFAGLSRLSDLLFVIDPSGQPSPNTPQLLNRLCSYGANPRFRYYPIVFMGMPS